MPAFIDLTNHRYGRWTVLSRAANNRHNQPRWLCRCECETEKVVTAGILRSGASRSCGCLNKDVHREMCIKRNTTHGMSRRGKRTRTYRIWMGLPSHRHYNAGPVCSRWSDFQAFLEDMGECPSPKHTIDRIDNSKGYEPNNCRWATMRQQQNNRTNNRRITHDGLTLTLQQWSRRTGLKRETIARRLDLLGWPVDEALTRRPNYRRR